MGARIHKKQWLLGCLIGLGCLSISNTIYAQEKIRYGIDMGVTVSFFDHKIAPYPDPTLVQEFKKASRPSLEIGGFAEYSLTDALSVTPGLKYSEKGGGYKTKNPDFNYVNQFGTKTSDAYNYLRYRLVYVELPVLVKLRVINIESKNSGLRLCGGFSGMLNIGSKFRYNVFEGASDPKEKWRSKKLDGAENFVLSWIAGAEWTEGPLILYARYAKTISDVYDTSKPGYENFDVTMGTVSIGLGFFLSN